jgi:hypothetical protein
MHAEEKQKKKTWTGGNMSYTTKEVGRSELDMTSQYGKVQLIGEMSSVSGSYEDIDFEGEARGHFKTR